MLRYFNIFRFLVIIRQLVLCRQGWSWDRREQGGGGRQRGFRMNNTRNNAPSGTFLSSLTLFKTLI